MFRKQCKAHRNPSPLVAYTNMHHTQIVFSVRIIASHPFGYKQTIASSTPRLEENQGQPVRCSGVVHCPGERTTDLECARTPPHTGHTMRRHRPFSITEKTRRDAAVGRILKINTPGVGLERKRRAKQKRTI